MPHPRRTYTEFQCDNCHRSFKGLRGLHSHLSQVDECAEAVARDDGPANNRIPSPAASIPPPEVPDPLIDRRARVEETAQPAKRATPVPYESGSPGYPVGDPPHGDSEKSQSTRRTQDPLSEARPRTIDVYAKTTLGRPSSSSVFSRKTTTTTTQRSARPSTYKPSTPPRRDPPKDPSRIIRASKPPQTTRPSTPSSEAEADLPPSSIPSTSSAQALAKSPQDDRPKPTSGSEMPKEKRRMLEDLNDSDGEARKDLVKVESIYTYYSTPSTNGRSIRHLVMGIRAHEALTPSDIIDLGENPPPGKKRYQVKPEQYELLAEVVKKLQGLLIELIALIPEREPGNRGFRIDPTSDLVEALRGTDRLVTLFAAYDTLRARIDRAGNFVERYYRNCKGEILSSPATTHAEVYDNFDPQASLDKRVLEYRAMTNTFGSQYSADQKDEIEAFLRQRVDDVVLVAKDVRQAFPLQPDKSYPRSFTYHKAPSTREASEHHKLIRFRDNDHWYTRAPYNPTATNLSFEGVGHSTSKSEEEVQLSVTPSSRSLEYEDAPSISSTIPGAFKSPADFFRDAPNPPKIVPPVTSHAYTAMGTTTDVLYGLGRPSASPQSETNTIRPQERSIHSSRTISYSPMTLPTTTPATYLPSATPARI
ncbi:hypothetical protein NLI96_g13042 [Meripilus lineatus]|uniref:Uncharacterized protein n=1 Tax=Meripilus lineatus TaxID=2056292 RepID=A0AAD5YBU7_9APHY|nr:hypothetical protein NLI96_g13042 [Physisporinus lineatus]